jgi:protein-S-isoprenylcysteine O-methyltransferase Ste14
MKTDFFIWFGICFLCYIIRTAFNILNYKKHPVAENRVVVISVFISMGVLWFSWFAMCFVDPIKMDIPTWLTYLGLVFFLLGVFLFIISHRKLKGFEGKDELVTTGIYSKIRNPMYVGFIIWLVGFPIFTHSFLTLTSSLIWVAFILYWKTLEEIELENKYKEYTEYKMKTWF